MSHTVAFCITIYSDCLGCIMLTRLLSLSIKTIRKRAQDMFNNSPLNCNKCDNVTVSIFTPVSSFVSKEATWLNIIQKAYVENNIIIYYFVNIFYFLHLIFSERTRTTHF